MGCVGLGQPLSIMGNNISFRRDAYDLIGGLMKMHRSVVEDMAMMNAVVRRTPYTLGWVRIAAAWWCPHPNRTSSTFINQRFRWIFEVTDLAGIGKIMMVMESLMMTAFLSSLSSHYGTPCRSLSLPLPGAPGTHLFLRHRRAAKRVTSVYSGDARFSAAGDRAPRPSETVRQPDNDLERP